MDPMVAGWIFLGVFAVLLVVGVPIGIAMALAGVGGFACIVGPSAALGKVAITPFSTMTDYAFTVVPAFILMAQIFLVSGLGTQLFTAAEKWLGHFRGGLALATIIACAVFAAISASTVATAVTIGLVALPEMLRRQYDARLASGSVVSGGGLGVLIPPSSILILYGLIAQQSIRDLFMAGIVPGLILAGAYCVVIAVVCKLNPSLAPPGQSYPLREKIASLRGTVEIVALLVLSLGGLFAGWFTPTEAGAVGASGAIILALLRRRLTWKGFTQAAVQTVSSTGMVVLILIGAFIFNYFAAATNIPQELVARITALNLPPLTIMLIITAVYLLLGICLDSLSMVLLTIPFIYPLATALGYDPVWFGVYLVLVFQMAEITPPIGMNLYVVSGLVKGLQLETVFRGMFPFLIAQVAVTLLLLFCPQLALFVPNLLR
jgi:tripartite ATP-independent transporter DctM subunit